MLTSITIWDEKAIDISDDISELTKLGVSVQSVPLFHSQDPQKIITDLSGTDFLIAGSERLDSSTLPSLKKLKLIVRFGVGYDNVDLKCAEKCGIAVANLPGSNAFAVAEHVLGMMIAVTHRMVPYTEAIKANRIQTGISDSLCGTVGILGFGAIGKKLSGLLLPFGVRILACDPSVGVEEMRQYGAEKADMDQTIRASDLLTLHLPATPETYHLVNQEFLLKMKDGAYLFNTARGSLMDESAVAEALASGKLAGVGADVYEMEPLDGTSPLRTAKNVILTPHTATATLACFHAVMRAAAHQIVLFYEGKPMEHLLTKPL